MKYFLVYCLAIFLSINLFFSQVNMVLAEPAPFPAHNITPNEFMSTKRPSFALTDRGAVLDIEVPNASWLEVKFKDFNLGRTGKLTIVSVNDRQTQTFSQEQLVAWDSMTAVFNGDHLQISLISSPEESKENFYEIDQIIAGDFISKAPKEDFLDVPEKTVPRNESICNDTDNRQSSSDNRVGRIMPIGCTGWIIRDNKFLTAGHCVNSATRLIEFNVPKSLDDGTPVNPPVRDQYKIDTNSIRFQDDGEGEIGNDWAVFRVLRNTETNLLPIEAQGGNRFRISNSLEPSRVRVTGFGKDSGSDNQIQQTESGSLLKIEEDGPDDSFAEYIVDTRSGNSGGPIIALDESGNDTDIAIGIHTNAGCIPPNFGNSGTSFKNNSLWQAIN